MRKITLICIGSLKEKYWLDAFNEYKKRLSRFFDFKLVELSEAKLQKNTQAQIDQVIEAEGKLILEKINSQTVFPLCVEGTELSSPELANLIATSSDLGEITFVIGGSYGLSDKVKSLGKKISFGKLTYPHQLMRVMFMEQLYRAGTILNNTDYHK